jgi:Recombination endonuclease VII
MPSRLTKRCTKCKETKSRDQFYRDNGRPDGLFNWCKECAREKRRETTGATPQPRSLAPEGFKWCSGCSQHLPLVGFYKSKATGDGLLHLCKVCRNSRDMRDHYEKTYGVPRNEIESMLASQQNKCAVCPVVFNQLGEARVDHCHRTGVIRGLLCHNCNVALGHMRDDPDLIQNLLVYLEERGEGYSV